MWGWLPRILSRSVSCRPVITASAMMVAITPTVTPMVETSEMTEMNACFRFASRYRSAMCSSKGRSVTFPQQRKQNDVPDRRTVGQEHHEAIDADALAAGRRQAVLERMDVVFVHLVRFDVASGAVLQLGLEPATLLRRIVQLAEGIRHLDAVDIQLEPLDRVGVVGPLLRQRRHLGW